MNQTDIKLEKNPLASSIRWAKNKFKKSNPN